jgi:tripeptide aminopeptidase
MRADRHVSLLVQSPRVRAASEAIEPLLPVVLDRTIALSRVASPTFHEADKAAMVLASLRESGLTDVCLDAVGNVLARRPGTGTAGTVVVSAHLDTVFPLGTPLDGRREGDYLRGPAVGDNSLGVATLLTLADILNRSGVRTRRDLLLVANVGEEGLGDLRGMRELFRTHGDEIVAVVALEGHTPGRVTHRAVGSRRLRIAVTAPGGHSWGDFGRPNAIHVLSGLIHQIVQMPLAQSPRSTFNIGRIEGGVSINTIAPSAWCELDLRSEDSAELERMVGWVEGVLHRRQPRDVAVHSAIIGDRPAGSLPPDSPIVAICCAALRALGIEPALEASSTDANVPIALGIPAVCLGITRGAGAHRTDEFVEIAPIPAGMRQVLFTALALAGIPSGG